MKTISSFLYGFSVGVKSIRMILLIYLGYLSVTLLLAIPFYGLFRSAAGNSLLPDTLMNGFDATAIRELLNSGGKVFGFFAKGFLPWILAFLLLQVYLNGGILSWISNPRGRFSVSLFTRFGRKYFWRFLKLAFYFMIIHLVISLILYLPFFIITGNQTGLTDQQVVKPFIILICIHMVILLFVFILSDLVKSRIFEKDSTKVIKSILKCTKRGFGRFFSTYLLSLLLLVVPVLIFAGFYLMRQSLSVNTTGMILVIFLFQQLVILIRIFLRTWRLSSVYNFYLEISPGNK